MRNLLIVMLIALAIAVQARGQSKGWPLDVQKNAAVTLKIPKNLIGDPKVHVWKGKVSYTISVGRGDSDAVLVNDHKSWQNSGWPLMLELRLAGVDSGKTSTKIQLKAANVEIYLRFAMAPEFVTVAFHEVAFTGTPAEFEKTLYYQKEVADRLLPRIFDFGKLSQLTREQQLNLIRAVNYEPNSITSAEYKGRIYVGFTVELESVYNTLQLGQTARVARVSQDSLLKELKSKYRILSDVRGVDGIQLKARIAYKSFADTYATEQYDDLIVYATLEGIKKFNDAEITNQQLLDQSIVLVNGDRVQVSLDQAK